MARVFSGAVLLSVLGLVFWVALGPDPEGSPEPVTTASRIVSLGPSFTEIVCYLGVADRLVGVTDFCEQVPAGVPRLGTFRSLDVEALIAADPDCVLGVASQGQSTIFGDLRRLGLSVEVLPGDSVADIRAAVVRIGEIVEAPARANAFVVELDRRLEMNRDLTEAPTVAFVVNRGPFFVAGRGSFVDGMLTAAGWRNAFADSDAKWCQVESEEIVQRQPDVIVDTTIEDEDLRRGWGAFAPHLDAVRKERVFPFPAVTPGVRIPGWIDRLAEIRASLSRRTAPRPGVGGKLKPG